MHLRSALFVGGLMAVLLWPSPARAQDASVPQARFQLGPLSLMPRLTINNIGEDTNVFNTSDNPTRDFTISFEPATGESIALGRVLYTGLTGVPINYFQKATGQRSVGFEQRDRVDINLIHLTPYATADYSSSFTRPNYEIDARVHNVGEAQTVGTLIQLGARTSFSAGYIHQTLVYDDTVVDGVNIAAQLNHRSAGFAGTFRMKMTPITSWFVTSTLGHDRFDSNALLNTNSLSLVSGLEIRKDSRLSGTLSLGVRGLRPLSPLVPTFTGLVGATSLTWLARDTTRIDGKFDRNVDYSINEATPYFIGTTTSVSVTQILVGHLDAQATVTHAVLAYRDELVGFGGPVGRSDRTNGFSIGSGYRFRIDARVGFQVTYGKRLSALDGHEYSGFQFGGTVSYGF